MGCDGDVASRFGRYRESPIGWPVTLKSIFAEGFHMRRIQMVLLAAVAVLGSVIWSATPAVANTAGPEPSYYLALGDSLSQGVQPGSDGTNAETTNGYPDQLYGTLVKSNPSLQLIKKGCPGETTTTMINGGGPCVGQYTTGNQLADAVQFLQDHRGHVADVTIDVGSNDVLNDQCVPNGSINTGCALSAIQTVRTNLDTIVRTLRGNLAGRTVRAAGMTYYDPLLALWPSPVASQSVFFTNLLNGVEAATYLRNGFRVAPVAFAFQTNNFRIPPGSTDPVNVAQICALTFMCSKGNIHPTDDGYKLIATTFAQTLR